MVGAQQIADTLEQPDAEITVDLRHQPEAGRHQPSQIFLRSDGRVDGVARRVAVFGQPGDRPRKIANEARRQSRALFRTQWRRQPCLRFSRCGCLAHDADSNAAHAASPYRPRAWTRSRNRSSISSRPTERRSRSDGHGVPAPSIDARCSIRLSTPPSDVARFQSLTCAAAATAAGSPPFTRIDIMPPKPPIIWRIAMWWPACVLRPGYRTALSAEWP